MMFNSLWTLYHRKRMGELLKDTLWALGDDLIRPILGPLGGSHTWDPPGLGPYLDPARVGSWRRRALLRTRRTDCALGSEEWAEPPQYLPALCWGVLAMNSVSLSLIECNHLLFNVMSIHVLNRYMYTSKHLSFNAFKQRAERTLNREWVIIRRMNRLDEYKVWDEVTTIDVRWMKMM